MNGFLCTLTLEEPLLANSLGGEPNSAESLFYIPGGAARGAFIRMYGADENSAHDDDFRRLFLRGDTRYLNAYPLVKGKRSLPSPMTWQVERKPPAGQSPKTLYRDLDSVPADIETKSASLLCALYKTEEGEFENVPAGQDVLLSAKEEWQVNVHTQRDAEKGRATSESGAVYRYIALPAGMQFQGAVLTQDDKDAQALRDLFNENDTIFLGKARTAGYGKVKIKLENLPPNWREGNGTAPTGDTATITLLSPAIVRDANGQYSLDIEPTLKARLGKEIQVTKILRQSQLVGGFNRKWGLPLPQVTALAAGSVFTVRGAKPGDLNTLEERGIGDRRAEGFGRVAVNLDLPASKIPWIKMDLEIETVTTGSLSANEPLAKKMLERLLRRDLDEQVIRAARRMTANYMKSENTVTVPNSQLSRWRVILRDALPNADIARVQKFAGESKGKAGWKKMEKARLQVNDQTQRLTVWIESTLEQAETLNQSWEAGFKPEHSLGSIYIHADEFNAEYRMRLLDSVLAVMSKKSGGKNG